VSNIERTEQLAKLESFRDLQRGWDSYDAEPPSEAAIDNASRVLQALWEQGSGTRARLVPSVEGGIDLIFSTTEDGYADIECFNDGEILAITSQVCSEPSVWPVMADAAGLRDAIVKIKAFTKA
jgi:hypothetical protein